MFSPYKNHSSAADEDELQEPEERPISAAGEEVLRLLLSVYPEAASLPVGDADSTSLYVLHLAAECGTCNAVEAVYTAYPAAATVRADKLKGSPLHISVQSGDRDKMRLLYSLCPEAAPLPVVCSLISTTILHCAVQKYKPLDLETVKLVYSFYPPNIRVSDPFDGLPLHLAISNEELQEEEAFSS
jgi:hypothetical protein